MPDDTSGELPKIIDDNVDNNYGEWVFKSHLKLLSWDLWKYVEGPDSTPPAIPSLRNKDAAPWMAANNTTLSKIASAVPSDQIYLIQNTPYAAQAWSNLRDYYQPHNSSRSQAIKKDIFSSQCGPNLDVARWLNDMQRLYSLLGDMDANSTLPDREFTCAIIDNLPQDAEWRVFTAGLRARISEYDARNPPTPICSRQFFTSIREEARYRAKSDLQSSTHVFSAHADADRRNPKRPRAPEPTAQGSIKRSRVEKSCTNPNCGRRGHDISECIAYGGGIPGKYALWWKGPWNLHLPAGQRSRANNVPPTSHPAYAKFTAAAHAATCLALGPADSTPIPTMSTTDGDAHILAVVASELPSFDTHLDDEIIIATLPILKHGDLNSEHCHYDSGANRHVFNNRAAFETYQRIQPVLVSGFGHDISTLAIGCGTVRLRGQCNGRSTTVLLTHVLHIPAARSNLISGVRLDKVGVTAVLGGGTATLSLHGQKIIEGTIHNDMFRLNISILHPSTQQSLLSRIENPPLLSRIAPLAAAVPLDRAGFYIA
jgi:gag-polypeptide of LTR copia-type